MDNFTQVRESSSGVPRLDVLINSPPRLSPVYASLRPSR